MNHPQSCLARYQPVAVKTDDELHVMAMAAWHKRGAVLIWVDKLANDWERELINGIAEREYGKREETPHGTTRTTT